MSEKQYKKFGTLNEMKKFLLIFMILIISCGKQPSELEQGIIKNKWMRCAAALNTERGAEPEFNNLFGNALGNIFSGNARRPDKFKWKLTEDPKKSITMEFKHQDTNISCDYIQENNAWTLNESRRNGEVVFNLIEDTAIKAANKELAEELAEEKRILAEELAEEKRINDIKQWKEFGYSNVSYKGYRKHHINSQLSSFSFEPTIVIDCKPEGPEFEHDKDRYSNAKDVMFKFLINEKTIEKIYDVSEYGGSVGKIKGGTYSWDQYMSDPNNTLNNEVIELLKSAESLEIEGFTWNIDDLNQVPCIS